MLRKLPFDPTTHGFKFSNNFQSDGAISTSGLCGGMCVAAFNYFRYSMPIPQLRDEDLLGAQNVRYNLLGLQTAPDTHPLIDYIFHAQLGTFQYIIGWFFTLWPTDYNHEYRLAKSRIDQGEYPLLGLRFRFASNPGCVGGHQVLCRGYDDTSKRLFVYDPNYPGRECVLTAVQLPDGRFAIEVTPEGLSADQRYEFIFEMMTLRPNVRSDRTTFDLVDNSLRNLNLAVRPPSLGRYENSIFAIDQSGSLLQYIHSGWLNGSMIWAGPNRLSDGWGAFNRIVYGGDDVVFATYADGRLVKRSPNQNGEDPVGSGWTNVRTIFSGLDGSELYMVNNQGVLSWYKFHGVAPNEPAHWSGPTVVGDEWQQACSVFPGGNGIIYAIQPDGRLTWYSHLGHEDGTYRWEEPRDVSNGVNWASFQKVFSLGHGVIYAVAQDGSLIWHRHIGHARGENQWNASSVVGSDWHLLRVIHPSA
ncbi:MAG: tachylectin-related carbohydrate-binding protein [Cyanobium sp.]